MAYGLNIIVNASTKIIKKMIAACTMAVELEIYKDHVSIVGGERGDKTIFSKLYMVFGQGARSQGHMSLLHAQFHHAIFPSRICFKGISSRYLPLCIVYTYFEHRFHVMLGSILLIFVAPNEICCIRSLLASWACSKHCSIFTHLQKEKLQTMLHKNVV